MKNNLLTLLAASSTLATFAADRPNILLVLSDDHSYPHLGAYGDKNCLDYNITPNIDAFAKESVLFTKGHVTSPHSAPSRVSIFTGMYPLANQTSRFGQCARNGEALFTDLLREAGYWVGVTGRNHHIDMMTRREYSDELIEWIEDLGFAGEKFNSRFNLEEVVPTQGDKYLQVGKRLDTILDGINYDKQPFFLYYGTSQPHTPWPTKHPNIDDPKKLILPPDFTNDAQTRKRYAKYLQAVNHCDVAFGQMMDVLKKRGLYENTIIIFVGDNGESLERGKGTVYDRGTHVPYIVRLPEKFRKTNANGTTSDALVSGLDVAATVLDAAGVKPASTMDGISLMPILEGKGKNYTPRKYHFTQKGWHTHTYTVNNDKLKPSRAVTDGRYLFKINAIPTESVPAFELFDLEKDPFQLTNLAADEKHKAKLKELIFELDKKMMLDGDYLAPPSEVISIHASKKQPLVW